MILVSVIAAMGCGTPATPTWYADIQPLINRHCVQCHQPGGAGPFGLTSYEEVARRATFIDHVIQEDLMPPWLPSEQGVPLRQYRGLPAETKRLLRQWIAAGRPRGEPAADTSPMREKRIGSRSPDLELTMASPWMLPAEGGPNWGRRDRDKRTFVVPVNNNQTLYITGVGHRTQAPQAVHATSLAFDHDGRASYLDRREQGPGYDLPGDLLDMPSGAMGGTGVGVRDVHLPPGYHWEVSSAADAVVQINYRPTGRPEMLHDSILLWTAEGSNSRRIRSLLSMIWRVDVPPGATDQLTEDWTLPVAVDLVGMTPRANGTVTSLRVSATCPNAGPRILLDIPEHDPHWSMPFILESPIRLPAGTRISSEFRVENTEDNPRNPFVPVQQLVAARRTGVMSVVLLVAAADPESDSLLMDWHQSMLKTRQRNRPVGSSESGP